MGMKEAIKRNKYAELILDPGSNLSSLRRSHMSSATVLLGGVAVGVAGGGGSLASGAG